MKAKLPIFLGVSLTGRILLFAQVQEAWVIEAGGIFEDHETYALAVDKGGHVYVTGNDGTVKYDTDGHQLWLAGPTNDFDPGILIAVDSAANVYVTCDIGLAKYDTLGNRLWVDYFKDLSNTIDYAFAMTPDDSSNVYVTGHGGSAGTGDDYVTAKYDGNGNELWSARYDGPGHSFDRARGLAVDASGNCYVTGASAGTNSGLDYATIKYDANGSQLWVARHNGAANGDDFGNGIALDAAGNVYVTGATDYQNNQIIGPDSFAHYTTIKYDTNGNPIWVARYSYTNSLYTDGSLDNEAGALTVDKVGNVYVTGFCENHCYEFGHPLHDYVTVKYDSNGNQLWDRAYDSDVSDCYENLPIAIEIDKEGNVYASGLAGYDSTFGGGGFGTVKYSPDGNELWRTFYAPGGFGSTTGFALDEAGNVYVTGYGCTDFGCGSATVKYVQGTNLPPVILDQPQNQSVVGGFNTSFSVRAFGTPPLTYQWLFDGAAFVGRTNTTLFLSSVQATNVGDFQVIVSNGYGSLTSAVAHLSVQLLPPSITSQPQSQTILEGDNVTFSVAAQNSPPLKYEWRFNAISLADATNATLILTNVHLGNAGDYSAIVYNLYGSATSSIAHLTVQSRTSSGVKEAWVRPPPQGFGPHTIAVDSAGNAYVFGNLGISGIREDYATIKYNPSGNQLWIAQYNGPVMGHTEPRALVVDGSGNVYVTGGVNGSVALSEYATVKYDTNGKQLWASRYSGLLRTNDLATALALDSQGNVYVTGFSDYVFDSFGNWSGVYATVKYDPNGNQLWVARHKPAQTDRLSKTPAIAVDYADYVYVAGTSGRPQDATTVNFLTLKYDPAGTELWAATYDGPINSADFALALASDSAGNALVIGSSYSDPGKIDYTTVKYGSDGQQLWAARYSPPGNHDDEPTAIAVGAADNIYVTGHSDYANSCTTVKYDREGNQLWVARYRDPPEQGFGYGSYGLAIALDTTGNAYVTGEEAYYVDSATVVRAVTIKYDPNGNQTWTATYNSMSAGSSLALDKSGNVFVAAGSVILKYVQDFKPLLQAPAVSGGTLFQFLLIGQAGHKYEIQNSSDLRTWTSLTNFLSATGTNLFSDPVSSSPRFYRALQLGN
jgi:hypothetical protein